MTGRHKLKEAIGTHGITAETAAHLLDVDRRTLFRWLEGSRVPLVEQAARIEDIFGVPIRSWRGHLATDKNR